MYGLYSKARALIMPTFFGPTNIPFLEAWEAGCAVVTSDIRGIREQVKDAALLIDPRSPQDIARGIKIIWSDNKMRDKLINNGRKIIASYTFSDYCLRLDNIIKYAKNKLKNINIKGMDTGPISV